MKNFFFLNIVFLFSFASINSQTKVGYINLKAIMEQLPEAQDAQKQFDAISQQMQDSLREMQMNWQNKYEEYDRQKLIMTEEQRIEIERELSELEKIISTYRNQKFSPNGELYSKQNELMKPIQNKIFKVLKEIAEEDNYDYIFDKSGEILLLYTREKYDLTEEVLKRMINYKKE